MSDWPEALTEAVIADAAGTPLAEVSGRPWRDFYDRALEAGIDETLAALGRAVMREAYLRSWSEDARGAAGVFDEGAAMIELASADPERAEREWSELLEHDGLA